jgi:hypothetical protein
MSRFYPLLPPPPAFARGSTSTTNRARSGGEGIAVVKEIAGFKPNELRAQEPPGSRTGNPSSRAALSQ